MDRIARRLFLQGLSSVAAAAGLSAPFQSAWAVEARRPTAPTSAKPYTIVIDAGHGGVDPGCIGRVGTYEKDVVLDTTLQLARQLEATKRYRIYLSRNSDNFVPLQERVIRARARTADLFLSVHADALPERTVRGASVFTLSEKASDREAAAVAERENRSDIVAGVNYTPDPQVNEILFDLARRETNNQSIRLAQQLVGELGRHVRLLPNTHRSAAFVVLKAPDIPSALVEIGCLSNHDEEAELRKGSYRGVVASALTKSVNTYFDMVARSGA
jgi:N-acetylmuramoyl-L-alanine amidase